MSKARLLTLEDVVDVIFGNEGSQNHTPWMKCLKTRMKNVLNVSEHAPSDYLMTGEIDSFVLVHIYQVSPDDLWDPLNYVGEKIQVYIESIVHGY